MLGLIQGSGLLGVVLMLEGGERSTALYDNERRVAEQSEGWRRRGGRGALGRGGEEERVS